MSESRNRDSVRVNEAGKDKLTKAKAEKRNHLGRVWSYADIASEAKVSDKTVQRFFRGKEDVDRCSAEAIANALNLNLADLIDPPVTAPNNEAGKMPTPQSGINWREICRQMLPRRLSSNPLMQGEDETFERDRIYVPLALVQRTKSDKFERSPFSPEIGSRLYEPQHEEKQRFEHEAFLNQIIAQKEGKAKQKQIALIGEAGAGKTTLLQTIAEWVLDKNLGFPVWITLADLGRNGRLTDFQTYFDFWLTQAFPVTELTDLVKQDFTAQIQQGKVWLLLDGVDEVAASGVDTLYEISQQLKGWIAAARIVLTCRLNVWQADYNALREFETYRLLDFDYPQQVHRFIDNWFAAKSSETGVVEPAKIEQAKRLKAELASGEKLRLRDLVQNPLRLTLLCSVWGSAAGNLPETKAGLYQQFVQQLYRWKEYAFGISQKEQRELNRALGKLALRDIEESNSRFRLRESFICEVLGDPDDEDSAFYKALKFGWLNHVGIAAESAAREKVYAFFHPSFEEYFAALAIDDWQFFLNHVPDNPMQGIYRIFEPQWKEVFLLWLGREDVLEEQKKRLLKILMQFDNRVEPGFYRYRAYFLAAIGIVEFDSCPWTDEIVAQLVSWSFGYFDPEKQGWQEPTLYESVIEKARVTLQETKRETAISYLTELLLECQDEFICLQAASTLGKIDPGSNIAIASLIKLLHTDENWYIYSDELGHRFLPERAAISLEQIALGDQTVIDAMVEIIHTSKTQQIIEQIAKTLEIIDPGNPTAIAFLIDIQKSRKNYTLQIHSVAESVEILHTSTDETKLERAILMLNVSIMETGDRIAIKAMYGFLINRIKLLNQLEELCIDEYNYIGIEEESIYSIQANTSSLEAIEKSNQTATEVLLEFIQICHSDRDRMQAASTLWQIDPGNQTAVEVLLELIFTSFDEYICRQVIRKLTTIIQGDLSLVVVKSLNNRIKKLNMNNFGFNDFDYYKEYIYEVLWHCSQNMNYCDFYQAWQFRNDGKE